MHLSTNFVKETGNTSLRVFAQNGKLWWLSHHNCSCSNDFNLSTRRGKSHADLLHFLKSRLKFGMAVALLWVSHTPEEHCSFTIKPKETDPRGAAMGSKGSASPPACSDWEHRGCEPQEPIHLLVPPGVLITSSVFWRAALGAGNPRGAEQELVHAAQRQAQLCL